MLVSYKFSLADFLGVFTVSCTGDADKSLARPGRKQATETEDFNIIYILLRWIKTNEEL